MDTEKATAEPTPISDKVAAPPEEKPKKTPAELLLDELPEIDPDILDHVDPGSLLDPEYRLEARAMHLVNLSRNYDILTSSARSARHQLNHKKANEIRDEMVLLRNEIAILVHENPGIKELVKSISYTLARKVKQDREGFQSSPEED